MFFSVVLRQLTFCFPWLTLTLNWTVVVTRLYLWHTWEAEEYCQIYWALFFLAMFYAPKCLGLFYLWTKFWYPKLTSGLLVRPVTLPWNFRNSVHYLECLYSKTVEKFTNIPLLFIKCVYGCQYFQFLFNPTNSVEALKESVLRMPLLCCIIVGRYISVTWYF